MAEKLNIQDIRIGDMLCSKDKGPMQVVAIYNDGTVYLTHESNPGTSLRFDIKDLHRHWNQYEPLKKITHVECWERGYSAKLRITFIKKQQNADMKKFSLYQYATKDRELVGEFRSYDEAVNFMDKLITEYNSHMTDTCEQRWSREDFDISQYDSDK